MSDNLRQAAQMALEALYPISHNSTDDPRGKADEAITILREALGTAAQPADTVTVRYDLSPAATESAIRAKLIEMGWTPPDTAAPKAAPAPAAVTVPVKWWNGCDKTVPAALRYLADNERPSGGEERFNCAHLYQLAGEIERMARLPLYTAPVPAAQGADNARAPNEQKQQT